MSYNIIGKFFLNNKPVFVSDFAMLKNLNKIRYSLTLDDHIESVSIPKEIEENISKDELFEHNGMCFNRKSFENALDYYNYKFEELKAKNIISSNLRTSLEFYKLDVEERERFEEDFSYNEEALDEVERQVFSLHQIIGVFDIIENMYVDGAWNYSSDVVLYLEAS